MAGPGTYVVLLRAHGSGRVLIGRLGTLPLDGGLFAYVGSAFGPGGLAARCRHHQRIAARAHWHLDYLRPHCRLLGFWVANGPERLEHPWAQALGRLPGAAWPLERFGSSDCRCRAHLIGLPRMPSASLLQETLGQGWWVDPEELDDASESP
ncbi:hypothetical protein CCR91_08440 [Thiorhodovibrio winogradskyi]|nr:hypothetical protein [Thiorhodovibrio winogradskyi]